LKSAQDERAAETCEWILRHEIVEKWRTDPTHDGFLWVYGNPGTGKTIITGKMIDSLTSTTVQDRLRVPLLYFFCNSKTGDIRKNNVTAVLRSFLFQLWAPLCEDDNFSSDWDSILELNQNSSRELILLEKILTRVFSDAAPQYIVIDAVDECKETETLVKAIRRLCASAKQKPKVYLTSRPEECRKLKSEDDSILEMSLQNTQTDIRCFVSAKLEDSKFDHLSRDMKEEIKLHLIDNANGM